jgi:carbonic anhydrase
MRKRLHLDAPSDPYVTDACVVCFDHRYANTWRKFLKRLGTRVADTIVIAGGAKPLASSHDETGKAFVLEQIRTSVRLHGTERVILIAHADCGAYGGIAAFGGSPSAEAEHHWLDLERACGTIRSALPGLQTECYFMNFDGVWESEALPTAS